MALRPIARSGDNLQTKCQTIITQLFRNNPFQGSRIKIELGILCKTTAAVFSSFWPHDWDTTHIAWNSGQWKSTQTITLTLSNGNSGSVTVLVTDAYSGNGVEVTLSAGRTAHRSFSLSTTAGWYDLRVTLPGYATFGVQLAGIWRMARITLPIR